LFDAELIHLAAVVGANPEGTETARRNYPQAPGLASTTARAILTRRPVIIPDVLEDPALASEDQYMEMVRVVGFRSTMSIPMLRAGKAIGAITFSRAETGPFSDQQLALLQTSPTRPLSRSPSQRGPQDDLGPASAARLYPVAVARARDRCRPELPAIHLLTYYRERFGFRRGDFPVA